MFGYVTINKPELKIRDFEKYHAYYCGLCHTLKKRYGRKGQITLTYDMTFLVMLLTSLYEMNTETEKHSCIVHPVKKHLMLSNEITEYAADMNVALSYHHFLDDWADERKVSGVVGSKVYAKSYKKIAARYERQCQAIEENLKLLAQYEKENITDVDTISRPFGNLMSELMVYQEDAFAKRLRNIGFYLGKFIYLMDAYMDREQDAKKGCFNPYFNVDEEECQKQMTAMIAEATKEFEKLPLDWDVCILRNILYEGVWSKYERKKQKNDE